MILSDYDILRYIENGRITITPFHKHDIGTNSYDLHLSPNIAYYRNQVLDCRKENKVTEITISEEGYTLMPGTLYLGATLEWTHCTNLVPCIEGKSSLARLGLSVHVTAGFGDSGFSGHWTLEMTVPQPLIIYPNMPVAQIYWELMSSSPMVPYDKKKSAKYNNQPGVPVPSMMYKNFE